MNRNWSNIALVAYPLLPKIVNKLDFAIISRVNSAFQSKHLKYGKSTEQLIDEIVQLTEQKRKAVNLYVIVGDALKEIEPKTRSALIARVIQKKTFKAISENANISMRTVFRRVADAEAAFAFALRKKGYTETWFDREYGSVGFMSGIRAWMENAAYATAKCLRD